VPLKVSAASCRRFTETARAIDELLVSSFDSSYAKLEAKFRVLERKLLLQVVRTATERRELKRRIAETLFTEAFAREAPWPEVHRALRRIQRLGYSHVERRYHVASLYSQWCQEHPGHDASGARQLLAEAERSIQRLPRRSRTRVGLLKEMAALRARLQSLSEEL
jgi:hypothetical protein